jgi:DNA modification methylase
MEFHEIAHTFPLLEGKEFDSLCHDIASNGLLEPIWTYQGKILDGRNRYRACVAVGVEPQFREYNGDNPLNFIISLNLERRHLNESQRAVIASKLANMRQGERTDLGPIDPRLSLEQAAELLNVGRKTVVRVKAVERTAPELVKKIERGEMTAYKAEKVVRQKQREQQRAGLARAAERVKPSDRWHIWQADIRTWNAPRQYDFIITDPPYPREYLPLWEVLARRANEWLADGGLLIAMSGQSYLDEIIDIMRAYLNYYWLACYLTLGQPTPMRQVNVNTTWKPLLIFTKRGGRYSGKIFGDVFRSDGTDRSLHEWQQSEDGMSDVISKICLPGQYILDPFCGVATTGVAALRNGCFFDGIEMDANNVKIGKGRLHDIEKDGTATQLDATTARWQAA